MGTAAMTEGSSQTNNARSPPLSRSLIIPGPLHFSIPRVSADATASVTRLQLLCAPVPAHGSARLLPLYAAVLRVPPPPRAWTRSFRRGICTVPRLPPLPTLSSPALPSAVEPRTRTPGAATRSRQARTRRRGAQTAVAAGGCGGRRAGAGASPLPAPPRSSADAPAPVAEPAPWRAAAGRLQPQTRSGPLRGPRAASRGIGDGGSGTGAGRGIPTQRGRTSTPASPGIAEVSDQKERSPLKGD